MLTKMKTLLRKTTKDLNDSKAQVSELHTAIELVRKEVEEERRGNEEAKVRQQLVM